jgi:hypothetical protein
VKPTAALMAIVFGSATAISFGLCATLAIFAFLKSDNPQLVHDLPKLAISCAQFLTLAAIAGAALYGMFKNKRWSVAASSAAWALVALIGWFYWPK